MPLRGQPYPGEGAPISALARVIERFAQTDGDHATAIPALTLHRRRAPTDPLHCIFNLGLGIVAQGGKQVLVGRDSKDYGPGQSMLTTVDLPVISHVTRASAREPFLGMMLTLNPGSIVQLSSEIELPPPPRDSARQSLSVETLDPALLDAALRLVKLLDERELALRLAPLVQQEITIRLLRGPHGPSLRHLGTIGSPSQQIAKAVTWLKRNFVEPLHVDELADRAHMSPSTLRQHFRAITGLSPLQFQKQLRLQEARQLMLSQNLDAGSAADRVGYQSASQFSREYGRLFGAPPQRDIKRMRQTSTTP
jgi:AraC-like DNA-binding protein